MAERLHAQYGVSTANLDARAAIHSYGVNPQSWTEFVRSRLPLRPGSRVLEVGCGPGLHWRTPVPDEVAVVLTDLHLVMCAAARTTTAALGVVQSDAQALPFADASFDLVLSMHVLYHVPSPAKALEEMLRVVLRPGVVGIATNGPGHMTEVDALAHVAGVPPTPAAHTSFSIDDADGLLRASGLVPERFVYEDSLRAPAEAVVAYVSSLEHPLDPAAEARVRAAMTDQLDADGRLRISKDTALLLAPVT